MSTTDQPEPESEYDVDDRGNVAQFYDSSGDIIATLDREASINGKFDQLTWDGGPHITEWAKANGYAEEIAAATHL